MADEPTIDLYGMPVKVSEFVPANMVGFISADGKAGVFADMKTGASFPMERNFDGFLVPKGVPPEQYSVAQHTLSMKKYVPTIGAIAHDDMELLDKARAATAARMRDFFDTTIYQTTTTTVTEPFDMAKLEQMLDNARRERIGLDKKMIRALRAAGLDVKVVEVSSRPLAILPAEYGDALEEVDREDRVTEQQRRMAMFKRCGFSGINNNV